jgi:hypothetical protein
MHRKAQSLNTLVSGLSMKHGPSGTLCAVYHAY